ncbi:hypothetical protein Scep_024206 [Stephania cephalantha]|uniref:Uncharacterized protein n=1 Tax=Stephania cephalantha TaxID=152367 RepID=A0AAP0EW52_9MAGN
MLCMKSMSSVFSSCSHGSPPNFSFCEITTLKSPTITLGSAQIWNFVDNCCNWDSFVALSLLR